jgi:hypothetical protein
MQIDSDFLQIRHCEISQIVNVSDVRCGLDVISCRFD